MEADGPASRKRGGVRERLEQEASFNSLRSPESLESHEERESEVGLESSVHEDRIVGLWIHYRTLWYRYGARCLSRYRYRYRYRAIGHMATPPRQMIRNLVHTQHPTQTLDEERVAQHSTCWGKSSGLLLRAVNSAVCRDSISSLFG